MSKRLDETVNEVYQSKIKEKEYEMRALQAQINPHFLYNSLSMINWKALEAEQGRHKPDHLVSVHILQDSPEQRKKHPACQR